MYIDAALNYFKGNKFAANVWQGKYAMRDRERNLVEQTPDEMHRRLAKEFARAEAKFPNAKLNEEDIYNLFKNFSYIIPQGSVMAILGNKYLTGSLSNCFVIGKPEDSYGGILQKDQELVQLMKRRGGVGLDISSLRPSGTSVDNAAQSSTGAVSFMDRFSNSTREVAQGGRRGALMLTIDGRHPEVEEFALIKQDINKVTGANISILLHDDFMKAVESNGTYTLKFPIDSDTPSITKEVNARKLWNTIVTAARNSAEPGLIFKTRHDKYCPSHIYRRFCNITTNPCGEIMMGAYDSCRLLAANIFACVEFPFTNKARFNYDKWYDVCYKMQRLGDNLVELELEYVRKIIDKIKSDPEDKDVKRVELDLWEKVYATGRDGRRTGNGVTGLGDALAALGLRYDSKTSFDVVDSIFRTKLKAELNSSVDMAQDRGAFSDWDSNLEELESNDPDSFFHFVKNTYSDEWTRMLKYGRRNISLSTCAPTGSLSTLAQLNEDHYSVTSGIEPVFSLVYTRRKKINPNDKDARVDFVDQSGDSWQEFYIFHEGFKMWLEINGYEPDNLSKQQLEELVPKSPYYKATAPEIDWVNRVTIQGIIQKYTTHSISSTINLPSDVSVEKVSEIYLESWRQGLKGITIYRDGSRTGVLVNDTTTKGSAGEFNYYNAIKRTKILNGELHTLTVKGQKYGVVIGLLKDKPYEIFVTLDPNTNERLVKGEVIKQGKGHYTFKSDSISIEKLEIQAEYAEERILTRLLSGMLRHGVNPKFIYEQIDKCDLPVVSTGKALSRVIKKYIPENELLERHKCKDCGSSNVRFEEGCSKCNDCGSSKC
jgi:ribonucleoside-diphosphate reductase alpha chain